jgi:hypothetical protein
MDQHSNAMIHEMVEFVRTERDIDLMNRKRDAEIVISRAALFNVCRGFYTASTLAKYFGMNHATILHHQKNHESLILLAYYKSLCLSLSEIRRRYDKQANREYLDIYGKYQQLKIDMDALTLRNEMLELNLKDHLNEKIIS